MNFGRRVAALAFLMVVGCAERPTIDDARREFSRQFPSVEISSIRIDEDEVAALTFEITVEANGQADSILLLYFYDGSRWSIPEDSRRALEHLAR